MYKAEILLTEAIKTYLQDKVKLGLQKPTDEYNLEAENGPQHMHEYITDAFAIKAADLVHFEGVCRAFNKVHSYKYITDPHFIMAFEQEMTSAGIPGIERQKASKLVEKTIKEANNKDGWCEQDEGWHPDMDEIIKASKPGISEST